MLEQIENYNEIVQIARKGNKNLAVLEVRSFPATLIYVLPTYSSFKMNGNQNQTSIYMFLTFWNKGEKVNDCERTTFQTDYVLFL